LSQVFQLFVILKDNHHVAQDLELNFVMKNQFMANYIWAFRAGVSHDNPRKS